MARERLRIFASCVLVAAILYPFLEPRGRAQEESEAVPARDLFHECPPTGSATDKTQVDPEVNRLKNREDRPIKYEPIELDEVWGFAVPEGVEKKHRDRWPAITLMRVHDTEDLAVAVPGYLLKAQTGGKESANCFKASDQTIRVSLAQSPDARRAESVVAAVTPRLRARHPSWTPERLNRLVEQKAKVRISGRLLLNFDGRKQLGWVRKTLWEIHPVMKIEVWRSGRWTAL